MKRRTIFIVLGLLLAAGLFYGGRSVYYEYYPIEVYPSEAWEPFVSTLDAEREAYELEVDGFELEAELFIPNGGAEQKAAVIFSPGSGDSLYQNYADGFVETYVLDVFLNRDIAVLLVNKRGMGESEGLYTDQGIEGRAEEILEVVEILQADPRIDAAKVGLVGHSEGGWVVEQAAGKNPEIAFFIGLAGPAITRLEQATDYYTYEAICSGLEGEELDAYVEKRNNMTELGMKIGKVVNFGMLRFDFLSKDFDPRNTLPEVEIPGLYVLAENDILVLPDKNIERMEEIFDGDVPENLTVVVAEGGTHIYKMVDEPCDSWTDPAEFEFSIEVVEILNDWLAEIGY